MGKLDEFIGYLDAQAANGSIYVWGGQGEKAPTVNEAWIRRMESGTGRAEDAVKAWKAKVKAGYGDTLHAYDCSGLGIYWLTDQQRIFHTDMTADTMRGKCKSIKRSDLRRGDWVFHVNAGGRATHIGYVVSEKLHVVEAKGRNYGVVKHLITSSQTSDWNAYGRPRIFEEEILGNASTSTSGDKGSAGTSSSGLIRYGDRGEEVRELQAGLNAAGFAVDGARLAEDGIFGVKTLAALEALQQAAGIRVDGVYGPDSAGALVEYLAAGSHPAQSMPQIRKGSQGDAVKTLQRTLGGLDVDGIFGSKTDAAVRAIQRAQGLQVDGIVGPKTWAALLG